jgi:hypothetical protein
MVFYAVPILFLAALIGSAITFPSTNGDAHGSLRILLLCLLPPFASAIWGRLFVVEPGSYNPAQPWWIDEFLALQVFASCSLLVTFIVILDRARLFALSVGLASLCATLAASFIGVMQVSGSWT